MNEVHPRGHRAAGLVFHVPGEELARVVFQHRLHHNPRERVYAHDRPRREVSKRHDLREPCGVSPVEALVRVREDIDPCDVRPCNCRIIHRRRFRGKCERVSRAVHVIGDYLKLIAGGPAGRRPAIGDDLPHQRHGSRTGVQVCLECDIGCRVRIRGLEDEKPLPRARRCTVVRSDKRGPVFAVDKSACDVVFKERESQSLRRIDVHVVRGQRDGFHVILEGKARGTILDKRGKRRIGGGKWGSPQKPVPVRHIRISGTHRVAGTIRCRKYEKHVGHIRRTQRRVPETERGSHRPRNNPSTAEPFKRIR